MNSHTTPDSEAPVAAESPTNEAIPAFRFPFSPELFSPARKQQKTSQPQGNKSNHDQRPGPAPRGTRRSMGKR